MVKPFLSIFKLTKVPLCLMVASSTAFGYLLTGTSDLSPLFSIATGVFLLACGAAAYNSIQEKEFDAKLKRTSQRPLVTGAISLSTAYSVTSITLFPGLVLLFFSGPSYIPFIAGIAALVLYNGIYTPLKQKTEFALIPGGISGAIPPLIGWSGAGGSINDPVIWITMTILFLWQPPHFCLLLLHHKMDNEINGCYINLANRFNPNKVKRLISTWFCSFTTLALFLISLPGLIGHPLRFFLIAVAILFSCLFLYHLHIAKEPRYNLLFLSLNGYLFCFMVILTVGKILEA